MWRVVLSLLVGVFALTHSAALAADEPTATADSVLLAHQGDDSDELKRLAAADEPDPWLVADELCSRGEFDAAAAFAKAAPRFDTEKLASYVASQRKAPTDPVRRKAAEAIASAVRDGKYSDALDLARDLPVDPADVTAVRAHESRGDALLAMRQYRESSPVFRVAADTAARLGWWTRHSWLLHQTALGAFRSGNLDAAIAAWESRLEFETRRGDLGLQSVILASIGIVHRHLGRYTKAIDCHRRALEIERKRDVKTGIAQALTNLGGTYYRVGSLPEALKLITEAVAIAERIGDERKVAEATGTLGLIHGAMGQYVESLACHERDLVLARKLKNLRGEARAMTNVGMMQYHLGRFAEALRNQRGARAIQERVRDKRAVAHTLRQEAQIHAATGAYEESMRCLEQALEVFESMRLAPDVIGTLGSIARVYSACGRYAEALRSRERSLKIAELVRYRPGIAYALQDITHIHESLGNYDEAERCGRRALKIMEEVSDRPGIATMHRSLGVIHGHRGDYEESMRCQERALKILVEVGDARGADSVRLNMGAIYVETGKYDAAKGVLEPLLARAIESNLPRIQVVALTSLATAHLRLGEIKAALALQDRAISLGEQIGAGQLVVMNLWGRARGYCLQKNYAEAIEVGRDTLRRSSAIVGRLSEEESARARGTWVAPTVEVGVRAAMALNDPAEVCFFLESGRAGTLLESLGGRAAMSAVALPKELLGAERTARSLLSTAQRRLERIRDSGDRKAVRAAWDEVSSAQEALSDIAARVERESKAAANIVYPRASELGEIQSHLAEGDALLHYASAGKGSVIALVVTPKTARVVRLGDPARIDQACAALRADDRGSEPGKSVKVLHDLIVAPLGLADSTRRLLICPLGSLSYLPFTLLAPDLDIAYVPSGTTLGFLAKDSRKRGEAVIALGDPEYDAKVSGLVAMVRSGEGLTRLPATRKEVEAVGDVVLLGADATVAALARASKEHARWRAVHFACHGRVDADRPLLSSLALTDSFLTPLDIFRMRIEADLAVLSACETAKGKTYRSEGVIGFTRAFMFAGTPRVIVSLWRVDDEATRALMVKFYELWKPGKVSTAAALKLAQKHVASHEKWRHPFYWAAWQLWGLPD